MNAITTFVDSNTNELDCFLQNFILSLDLFKDMPCDVGIIDGIADQAKYNTHAAQYIAVIIVATIINSDQNYRIRLSLILLISKVLNAADFPYAQLFELQFAFYYESVLCKLSEKTFWRVHSEITKWKKHKEQFDIVVIEKMLAYMASHKQDIISLEEDTTDDSKESDLDTSCNGTNKKLPTLWDDWTGCKYDYSITNSNYECSNKRSLSEVIGGNNWKSAYSTDTPTGMQTSESKLYDDNDTAMSKLNSYAERQLYIQEQALQYQKRTFNKSFGCVSEFIGW